MLAPRGRHHDLPLQGQPRAGEGKTGPVHQCQAAAGLHANPERARNTSLQSALLANKA